MYDLHLTNDQFWSITPKQFDILLERWVLDQERQEERLANISKIVVDVNTSSKGKRYKLQDFVVHSYRKKQSTVHTKPRQTLAEQLQVMQALHMIHQEHSAINEFENVSSENTQRVVEEDYAQVVYKELGLKPLQYNDIVHKGTTNG